MHDPTCIFCKIAQGRIPSSKISESEVSLAFLDVGPLSDGHVLVIPKNHYTDIRDIPPNEIAEVMKSIPGIAAAIMRATGATGLNILQNTGVTAGQAVFHLHFHLIPRNEGDRLGYRWNAGKYAEGRAEAIKSKILAEMAK